MARSKGFTALQLKALAEYAGPVTICPPAPAVGAYFGITNVPEEDLTIPAGGPMLLGGKRRGKGRGKGQGRTRRYGNFIYWSD